VTDENLVTLKVKPHNCLCGKPCTYVAFSVMRELAIESERALNRHHPDAVADEVDIRFKERLKKDVTTAVPVGEL